MSVKTVSPQNGGFIKVNELAPRLMVGKAKPFFFLIENNLSSLHDGGCTSETKFC